MSDFISFPYKMLREMYLRNGGDFLSDPIRFVLVNQSYTFDANHQTWGQISSYEISAGNGYATGGILLAGRQLVHEANRAVITATNPQWVANGTITAYGAIAFFEGNFLGYTNPLLMYERHDPFAAVGATNTNFTIMLPNNEFISIS